MELPNLRKGNKYNTACEKRRKGEKLAPLPLSARMCSYLLFCYVYSFVFIAPTYVVPYASEDISACDSSWYDCFRL